MTYPDLQNYIYEWKCENCGEEVEITRISADSDLGPSMNEAACGCDITGYKFIRLMPE